MSNNIIINIYLLTYLLSYVGSTPDKAWRHATHRRSTTNTDEQAVSFCSIPLSLSITQFPSSASNDVAQKLIGTTSCREDPDPRDWAGLISAATTHCGWVWLGGSLRRLTERTRSSAIAERPARRSASVDMLSHCCMNYSYRSRVSVKITFSNCHDVLFVYLHYFICTHRCNRLNYRTASMRCSVSYTCNTVVCRACDQPTLSMSTKP